MIEIKSVVIAFVLDHNGKNMIGVADSNKSAINLIKKSGYGWNMSQDELKLLEVCGYTTNSDINFKLETWQIHGDLS